MNSKIVRLIDANMTKEAIELLCKDERTNMTAITYFALLDLLDTMPTIEAERVNGWISVKDKLPKLFEHVLTYDDGGKIIMNWLEELVDEVVYFAYGGKTVTHWMPLPEPPKEVEE